MDDVVTAEASLAPTLDAADSPEPGAVEALTPAIRLRGRARVLTLGRTGEQPVVAGEHRHPAVKQPAVGVDCAQET